MKILGLDLAGTNCGWGVVDGDSPLDTPVTKCGRIATEKKGIYGSHEILGGLLAVVREFRPDIVGMEDLIKTPFSYRGNDLAEQAGIVKYQLHFDMHQRILLVHPSQVKHFLSPIKKDKYDLAAIASFKFGVSPVSKSRDEITDEMDAVTIAHITRNYHLMKLGVMSINSIEEYQRDIFISEKKTKVRRGKTVEFYTGLLQKPEVLLGSYGPYN